MLYFVFNFQIKYEINRTTINQVKFYFSLAVFEEQQPEDFIYAQKKSVKWRSSSVIGSKKDGGWQLVSSYYRIEIYEKVLNTDP